MSRIIITHRHVVSLGTYGSSVTAKAEYDTGNITLRAEHSVDLEAGGDDEPGVTGEHTREITGAARLAIAGAVAKLQAIVDASFCAPKTNLKHIKFEPSMFAKAMDAAACEKEAARPLSECEAVLPPSLAPVELHAVVEAFPHHMIKGTPARVEIVILQAGPDGSFTYLDTLVVKDREVADMDGNISIIPVEPFTAASTDQVVTWLSNTAIVGKGEKAKVTRIYVDTGWRRVEAEAFASMLATSCKAIVTMGKLPDFPTALGDGREWDERSDVRAEDLPEGMSFPIPERIKEFDVFLRRHFGNLAKARRRSEDEMPGWVIGKRFLSLEQAMTVPLADLLSLIRRMAKGIPDPVAARDSEGDPEQLWRLRYAPVYQRLFGDMKISVPDHLKIGDIESRLRERVDGQTSLIRTMNGEPGWLVGGQLLPLEGLLHLSRHALETRILCCLPSSR